MNKALELTPYIFKYLKFMKFIESCSEHTLKAYSVDLFQAYNLHEKIRQGLEQEVFSENSKKTNSSVNSKSENLLPLDSEELLKQTKISLNRWAELSLSSRNRKIATLKSFFNWLYAESLVDENLSHRLISPKVPKKIPHYLSVDEALACLQSLTEEQLSLKVLFLLLYGCGLRVSEACHLEWKNIDFSQGQILVRGKVNKERLLSAPYLTFQNLKDLKKTKSGDYVFGSKPLSSRTAYDLIRSLGAQAQLLKPLHPHALRHSFATHMLSSGSNLRTLQKILGHESLQATEKYTHLGIDQLARTIEAAHPLTKRKLS